MSDNSKRTGAAVEAHYQFGFPDYRAGRIHPGCEDRHFLNLMIIFLPNSTKVDGKQNPEI
jgi:hypothetical protein